MPPSRCPWDCWTTHWRSLGKNHPFLLSLFLSVCPQLTTESYRYCPPPLLLPLELSFSFSVCLPSTDTGSHLTPSQQGRVWLFDLHAGGPPACAQSKCKRRRRRRQSTVGPVSMFPYNKGRRRSSPRKRRTGLPCRRDVCHLRRLAVVRSVQESVRALLGSRRRRLGS